MLPQVDTARIERQADATEITVQHALFADLVASGETYTNAAEAAGFARETGRTLAKVPAIRQRIDSQLGDPTRARVIADYTLAVIKTRDATSEGVLGDAEWRANMDLHLRALDKLSKICGWIIDRKQVDKRSMNASIRVTRDELEAKLQADLERLAPGAATALERLGRPAADTDLKAIAAGDVTVTSHKASRTNK